MLEQYPAYAPIQQALSRSKDLLDNLVAAGRNNDMYAAGRNNDVYSDAVVDRLKRIWKGCGQECAPL